MRDNTLIYFNAGLVSNEEPRSTYRIPKKKRIAYQTRTFALFRDCGIYRENDEIIYRLSAPS